MRLLVTRPEPEATAFAEKLRQAGHSAIVAPFLQIEGCAPAKEALFQESDAIVLTSARALAYLDAPAWAKERPLFAVGHATAAAARSAGFRQVVDAGRNAVALAAILRRRLAAGSRLLHPSGQALARDLAELLAGSDIAVRRVVVYRASIVEEMPSAAMDVLQVGHLDGATFFSPRTAKTFVRLAKKSGLEATMRPLLAFCLSPAVAVGLADSSWQRVCVATQPDGPGLLQAIESQSCGGGRT